MTGADASFDDEIGNEMPQLTAGAAALVRNQRQATRQCCTTNDCTCYGTCLTILGCRALARNQRQVTRQWLHDQRL